MTILKESNYDYFSVIGPNMIDGTKEHRFMKFLMIKDDEKNNAKIIYNYLTCSLIWIRNEQFDTVFTDETTEFVDWLWKNYFIVNNDYDELEAVEKIRKHFKLRYDDPSYCSSGNISAYTILTTTACNARCFYCYEKGRPQHPMTTQTAKKVGDYIVRTARKTGETIELRWFGGEPLVNENAIDIICQIVRDAGYNYISTITSNGFLFNPNKLEKYKDLWHLNSGQITIDGTEKVYNKAKNYKNVKGKSPYQIVLNNIRMLLDNNISLAIRINLDAYNFEDVKDLVKELHDKFGNSELFKPYCYPIFEDETHQRTDEELKKLYENCAAIDEILKENGYIVGTPINPNIRISHCMVDSGHQILIGTNGDIGLCEHYSEDHFFGHIDKPEMKDLDELKLFWEHCKPLDICKDCQIYPACTRIDLCADLRICNEYKKEWQINHSSEGVRIMYNNIINDLEKRKEEYSQQVWEEQQRQNCDNQNCDNQNCDKQNCDNQNCDKQNCCNENCDKKDTDNLNINNNFWKKLKMKLCLK